MCAGKTPTPILCIWKLEGYLWISFEFLIECSRLGLKCYVVKNCIIRNCYTWLIDNCDGMRNCNKNCSFVLKTIVLD